MATRNNRYRLLLEQVSLSSGQPTNREPLSIEFENHDEIFSIIDRIGEKEIFKDKNQATEFAIGLKLFSEVLLKDKDNQLFTEFRPAFAAFMKKLKSSE